jgi:hypothetical protein
MTEARPSGADHRKGRASSRLALPGRNSGTGTVTLSSTAERYER